MPNQRDKIRATFPVPTAQIQARKLKAVLGSPITWAPYLPVMGAFTLFDIGVGLFAVLAIGVTGGLFAYWKSHSNKIEAKGLEQLVAESNQKQDAHLVASARKLLDQGYPHYAHTLGSFLEKKQQIERALHDDASDLSIQKREMETLTDDVVFGVADQINRLVQLDDTVTKARYPLTDSERMKIDAARSEIGTRIEQAYSLLKNTRDNLPILLNPAIAISPEDTSHTSLDLALDRLGEEQKIALRVRERMVSDFGEMTNAPFKSENDANADTDANARPSQSESPHHS
jgi:hypothetical protein